MEDPLVDRSIIKVLRSQKYKATPQRIAICRFVLRSRAHPTAKKILSEVELVYPTVSLSTVYKTLNILKKISLIKELPFPQGESRFDSFIEPHLNLICKRCGNISDVYNQTVLEAASKAALTAGFSMISPLIELYGICGACTKESQHQSESQHLSP
jgi:Fur family peroxide stress response transcriptional regulator